MQIAKRVYSLAQEQNDSALMIGAYRALAVHALLFGRFRVRATIRDAWPSDLALGRRTVSGRRGRPRPPSACLCYEALSEWHLGEIASCHATMAEAISLAKELNDMHALAVALHYAAFLGHYERNPAEVERLASDLIELSTRHNFAHWLAMGAILRGWARSASGDTAEGISWIEDGIEDYRATGSMLGLPFFLGLKAEALHLADRTSEALEAIKEAEALVERSEERRWSCRTAPAPRCVSCGYGC